MSEWKMMYVGPGVVSVGGVGVFAKFTQATVDEATARLFLEDADWSITGPEDVLKVSEPDLESLKEQVAVIVEPLKEEDKEDGVEKLSRQDTKKEEQQTDSRKNHWGIKKKRDRG